MEGRGGGGGATYPLSTVFMAGVCVEGVGWVGDDNITFVNSFTSKLNIKNPVIK